VAQWERLRVLATVKAYPQISDIGESVCVAGINLDAQTWIRLYPLPFRDLPRHQQFAKYATIELQAKKSSFDSRPESYIPNIDTISVIRPPLPTGKWAERRRILKPFVQPSMCAILRDQSSDGISLGMFKPDKPIYFIIEERSERDWSADKQRIIDQGRLFVPEKTPLQKIPYRFKYQYRCREEPACNGHRQTIVDWEISEAFRDWQRVHGEEETLRMIRQKWTDVLWAPDRDTYLYVGNQLAHPKGFLVVGVFWPPVPRDVGPRGPASTEQLPLQ
jgi:hypothetical protein